ncbi:VOC family protein [Alkalihalobacillus pseudalcaliphilus]|uniref:VOC family protein n=1 Tax=Alkalihalobacillus pseudalcaliphilus TaxID=79884 RepID=UPI00064D8F85|nr:VOC family protein [Alkalihalobacillus pseudalcaliphilus]KMK77758.1 hypothetical protein AB990_04715 [Alkalihalobacillus pseudalcaliphilus]
MNVHHIGIEVTDLSRSTHFYQRYFQAQIINHFFINNEEIIFLKIGSFLLELSYIKGSTEKQIARHQPIHFAIEVPSLVGQMNLLKQAGLYPIEGPFQLSNGWKIAYYEGVEKEIIELISTEEKP